MENITETNKYNNNNTSNSPNTNTPNLSNSGGNRSIPLLTSDVASLTSVSLKLEQGNVSVSKVAPTSHTLEYVKRVSFVFKNDNIPILKDRLRKLSANETKIDEISENNNNNDINNSSINSLKQASNDKNDSNTMKELEKEIANKKELEQSNTTPTAALSASVSKSSLGSPDSPKSPYSLDLQNDRIAPLRVDDAIRNQRIKYKLTKNKFNLAFPGRSRETTPAIIAVIHVLTPHTVSVVGLNDETQKLLIKLGLLDPNVQNSDKHNNNDNNRPRALSLQAKSLLSQKKKKFELTDESVIKLIQYNINLVHKYGFDGIFLINHGFAAKSLVPIIYQVRQNNPHLWIGVNFLGVIGDSLKFFKQHKLLPPLLKKDENHRSNYKDGSKNIKSKLNRFRLFRGGRSASVTSPKDRSNSNDSSEKGSEKVKHDDFGYCVTLMGVKLRIDRSIENRVINGIWIDDGGIHVKHKKKIHTILDRIGLFFCLVIFLAILRVGAQSRYDLFLCVITRMFGLQRLRVLAWK